MKHYFHWTCWHGETGIIHTRRVIPNKHTGLSWWTDLQGKGRDTRAACGLSSLILTCDRMTARFAADKRDAHLIVPWTEYRHREPPAWVTELESAPGAEPGHWFVATEPVRVVTS